MHANGHPRLVNAPETPTAEAAPAPAPAPPAWFQWAYAGALAGGLVALPALGLGTAAYLGLLYRVFKTSAGL